MNDTCSPPSHNNHPPPAPLCPNITYRFSGLISFHFLTNQLREFKNLMIKVFLIWWSCHSQIFSLKTFVMVPLTCKSCKKNLSFLFPELKQRNFPANGTMNLFQSQSWVEKARQYFGNPKAWEKNSELQITTTFYNILKDSNIPKLLCKSQRTSFYVT